MNKRDMVKLMLQVTNDDNGNIKNALNKVSVNTGALFLHLRSLCSSNKDLTIRIAVSKLANFCGQSKVNTMKMLVSLNNKKLVKVFNTNDILYIRLPKQYVNTKDISNGDFNHDLNKVTKLMKGDNNDIN